MQFPWMMYRKGKGLALPRGQSVECQAALGEAEYADAIKAGWFPSIPEALAENLDAPEKVKVPAEERVPSEVPTDVKEPAARRGRPRREDVNA